MSSNFYKLCIFLLFIMASCTSENSKKEESIIETMLDYQTGLDKYFGLVAIAEKYKIFNKVSTRFELPDGTKVFEKAIVNNPQKYFTEDIMKQLEEAVFQEFNYGSKKGEDSNEVDWTRG